jgi:voltage-gated sodium channel
MASDAASQAGRINGFRQRLVETIEAPFVRYSILAVIVINAITLGLATSPTVMGQVGDILLFVDNFVLGIFIVELSIKFFAYGWRFFLSGWNIFDAVVVSFSLLPATGDLSILRALRIIRAMRILSVIPHMRHVIQALIDAMPGMGSVMALLAIIFYIFAVMATRLFGETFPDWFGTVGESLYSLFQIMTLESWSMGIARPVMEVYPFAWLLFVPFIIITAFAVLNLFIGLLVNTMQSAYEAEREDEMNKLRELIRDENRAVAEEIREFRRELAERKKDD